MSMVLAMSKFPTKRTWSLTEKDHIQFALDVFGELNYNVSTNLEAYTEVIAEKVATKLGYDYKKGVACV